MTEKKVERGVLEAARMVLADWRAYNRNVPKWYPTKVEWMSLELLKEAVAERDIPEDSEAEKMAKELESGDGWFKGDHFPEYCAGVPDCPFHQAAALLRRMDAELKERRGK